MSSLDPTSVTSIPELLILLETGNPGEKEYAAGAFWKLSSHSENQSLIGEAPHAISRLVDLLSTGSDLAKQYAAAALTNLACHSENQSLICDTPHAISRLVNLLSTESDLAKEYAAAALINLACHSGNQSLIAKTPHAISRLVNLLSKGSDLAKEYAAEAFCKLSSHSENQSLIARTPDAISRLVDFLSTGAGTDLAKEYAAKAFFSLVSHPANKVVIGNIHKTISCLVKLLSTGTDLAKKYAAGALSNLAIHPENQRQIAHTPRAISRLVDFLSTGAGTDLAKEYAAKAFFSLVSHRANKVVIGNIPEAISYLVDLLSTGTPTTQENSALALWDLAIHRENQRRIADTHDAISRLVDFLSTGAGTDLAKKYAAKAFFSLVSHPENKVVIGNIPKAISYLVNLLSTGTPTAQENSAEALSNLAIHPANKEKIGATTNAISRLVGFLSTETVTDLAKEYAAGALANLACHSENQRRIGKNTDAISYLVHLLSRGTPTAQENSAAALSNLAIHPENQGRICTHDTISRLVDFLSTGAGRGAGRDLAKQYVAAALQDLAVDPENRVLIGNIPKASSCLVELLSTGTDLAKQYAAGALQNLTIHLANQPIIGRTPDVIPRLLALLETPNDHTKEYAQRVLTHLGYHPRPTLQGLQPLAFKCSELPKINPDLIEWRSPAEIAAGVAKEACEEKTNFLKSFAKIFALSTQESELFNEKFITNSQTAAFSELLYARCSRKLDINFGLPPVTPDEITMIGVKIKEGIEHCTAGFTDRLQSLVSALTTSKNLDEFLCAIRVDLINQTSAKNHGRESIQEVHANARFQRVAAPIYATPFPVDDVYRGSFDPAEIREHLSASFIENYNFFGILYGLREQLHSRLLQAGYIGANPSFKNSYGLDLFYTNHTDKFLAILNDVFPQSLPLSPMGVGVGAGAGAAAGSSLDPDISSERDSLAGITKWFVLKEDENEDEDLRVSYPVDLNWAHILQNFATKLISEGYIRLKPSELDLLTRVGLYDPRLATGTPIIDPESSPGSIFISSPKVVPDFLAYCPEITVALAKNLEPFRSHFFQSIELTQSMLIQCIKYTPQSVKPLLDIISLGQHSFPKFLGQLLNNAKGFAAISYAIEAHSAEAILLLLESGAKPSQEILTKALHLACQKGDQALYQYFLDNHPDIRKKSDLEGNSPLMLALMNRHYDLASFILDENIRARSPLKSLTKKNKQGLSVLQLAVSLEKIPRELIDKIIEHNRCAGLDDLDDRHMPNHETLLMATCRLGNLENTRCLLDHGAKVHHVDDHGDSALNYAIEHKKWAVATLLLTHTRVPDSEKKIISRQINARKITPLILAVSAPEEPPLEFIKLLLAHGALKDLNYIFMKDGQGWNALDIALKNGNMNIAELLIKAGAECSDYAAKKLSSTRILSPREEDAHPDERSGPISPKLLVPSHVKDFFLSPPGLPVFLEKILATPKANHSTAGLQEELELWICRSLAGISQRLNPRHFNPEECFQILTALKINKYKIFEIIQRLKDPVLKMQALDAILIRAPQDPDSLGAQLFLKKSGLHTGENVTLQRLKEMHDQLKESHSISSPALAARATSALLIGSRFWADHPHPVGPKGKSSSPSLGETFTTINPMFNPRPMEQKSTASGLPDPAAGAGSGPAFDEAIVTTVNPMFNPRARDPRPPEPPTV